MRIQFNGAAHTVTGSQHLLELGGRRLLLDCGLYQGKRQESYARNQNFAFDPPDLDAVILSHAHIDHSGNLPNLVKKGYAGPIYTTSATAELADVMLRDSGHIQEADAQFMNKRIAESGSNQPPVQPLYTLEDAASVARQFRTRVASRLLSMAAACQYSIKHIPRGFRRRRMLRRHWRIRGFSSERPRSTR